MSEAIRSYRPSRRTYYEGPTRSGGMFRWLVLLFFVGGAIWFVWTTRDSCPVERVIPRNQSFHFQARDLLATRQKIAHSPLWDTGLVPENYAIIPSLVGNSFGYPDWVLNNLISDVCYISGTDLMAFTDLLVVTRMSRIGCLLERYHRFLDAIEDEYAGGLALRKLNGVDLYYAVRGRTIIFSPSREALIRALTLQKSDAIESLENEGLNSSTDLQGRMAFSDDEPLGRFFEQSDCLLDFNATSITFSSRSVLKADWRAPLDALNLTQPLSNFSVPSEGGLLLAGEFGVPLSEVWQALDKITAGTLNDYMNGLGALAQLSPSERENFRAVFGALAEALGTGFSLRTAGFDLDGLVPMPIFDLSFQPVESVLRSVLEKAPEVESGGLLKQGVPYYGEEDKIVRLALGWGDIIEPSGFWEGGRFHSTLLPAHVTALRSASNEMVTAPGTGHLFLRLRPHKLIEAMRAGALRYAAQGMIPGHSADSLGISIAEVDKIAGRVPELSVLVSYLNGELSIAMRLELSTRE